jgi:hypothetical protein
MVSTERDIEVKMDDMKPLPLSRHNRRFSISAWKARSRLSASLRRSFAVVTGITVNDWNGSVLVRHHIKSMGTSSAVNSKSAPWFATKGAQR